MKPSTKNFQIRWLLVSVFLILTGCEGYESSIPDAYVYVVRNIYATKLNEPGTTCYISSSNQATDGIGYGGIIIVHAFDGEYYAFDLACPVEHDRKVLIEDADPELKDLVCKCNTCKEEYELGWGSGIPTNNISKEPLRRYRIRISNDNIIVTR